MVRLIDADALVKDLRENYIFTGFNELLDDFASAIRSQPTVDAVPVRHGRWIHEVRYTIDSLHSYQQYRCSECDMTYITNTKYCPNCGARMDAEMIPRILETTRNYSKRENGDPNGFNDETVQALKDTTEEKNLSNVYETLNDMYADMDGDKDA